MDDGKVYHMSEDMEDQCLTEDSKVRLYLSPLRYEKPKRGKETAIEKAIMAALALPYSIFITYLVGRYAIEAAARSRGYDAIGGEYILIVAVFLGTFLGMYKLLKGYKRQV